MRDSFAEELTCIQNAEQELKRIDHLIYVSLKYTRTVDVFKNVLQRFVTTGDYLREALLEHILEIGVVEEIPNNQVMKAEIIKKQFNDNEPIQNLIRFHQMLRRVNRADFSRKNEYRRHVTMTVIDGPDIMEIKIETLTDYYQQIKEYFRVVKEIIQEDESEE